MDGLITGTHPEVSRWMIDHGFRVYGIDGSPQDVDDGDTTSNLRNLDTIPTKLFTFFQVVVELA